ncbi:MAG: RQC domain-containing protein, partial [Clostridiaceae bacterium]
DGETCNCYLLYSREDISSAEYLINTTSLMSRRPIELKKLNDMVEFCEIKTCYKEYILNYFGERTTRIYCASCSNCFANEEFIDFTVEAQKILSCVYRTKENYGISVIIDILRGVKGPKITQNNLTEITTFGIMKEYSGSYIKNIIKTLINDGYVHLRDGTYSMLKLNEKSIKILKGNIRVFLKLPKADAVVCEDEELFKALRLYRKDKSVEEKVKPYILFSDKTLVELANKKPVNQEELLSIQGIGERKLKNYGSDLLKIIKKFT